jgi:putative ABC transport system permease protein
MTAWLRLSLRRLSDARATALALAVFVFVTALVMAAAPRMLDTAADGAFRDELMAARSSARNLALIHEGRLPTAPAGTDDPYAGTRAVASDLEARFPDEVRELVADRSVVVSTPRFSPGVGGSSDQTMRLRFQPGAADRVRIVRGRMPASATPATDQGGAVIEVAVSAPSAAAFGVGLGSRREIRADRTDLLADERESRITIEVVGILEPLDPTDPFWYDDPTLWEPRLRSPNPDLTYVDVVALAADAAYPTFMAATEDRGLPVRTAMRWTIDPARLEVSRLDAVTDGLRRMETVFPAGATEADGVPTELRTELLGVLEAFGARWRAAQAVLAVMAAGVLAIAAAALALVAVLLARRRRTAVGAWRWRGASRLQVHATLLAEGLILAIPGAVGGVALAIALLPAGPDVASVVAAGFVAAIAIGSLLLAIPGNLVGPPHAQAREGEQPRTIAPRRLAAEIVVIVIAVIGAFLVRDRGLGGAGAGSGEPAGAGAVGASVADPFIAAVPVLLGIAVGLLVLRLFRIPLRGVAVLAARRSDLVPSLALRRVTRGGTSGPVLLVLLATVSVATFASVMLATLDAATTAAAWGRVGAPYLLDNGDEPLDPSLDPAGWPGVEATAGAWRAPVVIRQLGVQVDLVALDAAPWKAVNAGTPIEDALPPELLDPTRRPVPVLVSRALAASATAIALGDTFPLTVEGGAVDAEVVAIVDAFPSLDAADRFMVVSRAALQAEDPALVEDTMRWWLRAPDAAAADLRATAAERPDGPRLIGRAETAGAIAGSPVVTAVRAGLLLATLVAVVYAALAVGAALTLTGSARAIEVARLRALGLRRREAIALDLVEQAPTVLMAFGVGAILGWGTFVALRDGLGLDAIAGWPTRVPTTIDPLVLLAILGAVALIVAGGILAAARIAGRVSPAAALRRAAE